MTRFASIGKALRFLREQQGWSQKDLAATAGITGAMLSNYETGEKKPSLDSLGKLLDALGLYLGKFDDALDVVNERPPRGERMGGESVAGARALAVDTGGEIDVRAFIGVDHELPPDLEEGFAEMIKGFRQIARYMYRSVVDAPRRGGS
jgi:transcriptional regulator with XRE-family HTH domain